MESSQSGARSSDTNCTSSVLANTEMLHAAEHLAESLGKLMTEGESGSEALATALWAWGQLAADGAFTSTMSHQFDEALKRFNKLHMPSARPRQASKALVALALLVESGHKMLDADLEEETVAGVVDRFCALVNAPPSDPEGFWSQTCEVNEVLGDVLSGLAVVGRLPKEPTKLRALALAATDPVFVEGASLRTLGRVLWSLSKLQVITRPLLLLPENGLDWCRLCDTFVSQAAEKGDVEDDVRVLFHQALRRLSRCGDSGAPGGDGAAVRRLGSLLTRSYLQVHCDTPGCCN